MFKFFSSRLGFFWVAVVLFWIKTYSIYKIEFLLGVKGAMQEFLLFFNPLSSGILLMGLALFLKGKRAGRSIIYLSAFLFLILYSNVVYYRFNSDFITLATLTQTSNFGSSLGGSIINLMEPYDILYLIDILFLIYFYKKVSGNWTNERLKLYKPITVLAAGVIAFSVNLHLAEKDRPQLLERTFDRNYLVKYLGTYNFILYDSYLSVQNSTQRVLANSSDLIEVENYTKAKYADPNPDYFGMGSGKNIIKIHLESFQSFLIDYKLNGEEVTPFLNSLVHDSSKNFTYFDNFFHQTEQGKTADAELIMDTSLYGLSQGAAFVTKGKNTFQSLPAIMHQQQGYTSAVFHGDGKSFWNRDKIYKRLGIDQFYYDLYYNMSDENVINYGLKDKPFFKESVPMLKELKQPFYAHMITLTNHHPFILDEEEATIASPETGNSTVDGYFRTARYLDEALAQFFHDLKEAGLYDDSIIMIYGDHYGISSNHKKAMEEILNEEITPLEYAELQRVPLMIRIPGVDGQGINHEYAGMVDVVPTLLHILGIDAKDYLLFGSDLFSKNHRSYVPFRNGDFVTAEYSYIKGVFYNNETKEPITNPTDKMVNTRDTVLQELGFSDKLLNGDLLRFYTPNKEWKPIDARDYHYGKPEEKAAAETR
ncbi:LTA synthase family protein [Mesobacillus foraminis]|uniref:Lipoteichoic acid synthase n=1 Tax=Mesobacillus foraminis TaxID=279826 RepID=A0A4R2B2Z9_9BACI|nr:LTA synthase family protein [Mesobacillus foraminis]TCN20543.1 lipoteichoic acid synthase [Mesobacillus foraminis]